MIIVIEGLDGSGKTTQVRLLADHLRGKGQEIIVVEEPGTTGIGQKIRDILLGRENKIAPLAELFLYEASRAQLVQEVLRPALAAGKIAIADRFALSSLAYQGYGRGVSLEVVRELNRIATDGLEPDLVFLLDIPPEEGLERKRKTPDRMESGTLDFYRRVREGYLKLIEDYKGGYLLDGRARPAKVFRRIVEIVEATRAHDPRSPSSGSGSV
jgi:dTMP kinase